MDNDEELLSQVSSTVGLDAESLLASFKEEVGLEKDAVLAQLRSAENVTELVQVASTQPDEYTV